MRTTSQGFILFAVLTFLQLFSLLGLLALMQAANAIKTIQHLWQGDLLVLESEQYLSQLELRFSYSSPCLIPVTPAVSLAHKPLAWWQQNACQDKVNHIAYYAVIESLGKDPCAVIQKSDNQLITADFYRITLLAKPDVLRGSKVVLQSVIARPVVEVSPCQTGLHLITLGRQRWRDI